MLRGSRIAVLEAVACFAHAGRSHVDSGDDRKAFMSGVHLTCRDEYAYDLESIFNFDTSPWLNAVGVGETSTG